MTDRVRLARLFGSPDLAPLLARMRKRLEHGHSLTGTLVFADLGSSQRAALASLLGRPAGQTGERGISIPLDELAEQMRASGLCDSLREAVELLTGPVANVVAAREERTAAWAHVFDAAPEILRRAPLAAWLAELRGSGLLKRLVGSSPFAASQLLSRLALVVSALPAGGEPLASFAAATLGDAHALDPGSPLGTLAVRAAARIGRIDLCDDAEGRRDVWAGVGVMCDELSTPVLVLNLPLAGETPLCRLARCATADAEPFSISLRLLAKFPLANDAALAGREVYVCENPTIVALAAQRLGARCAPLACVSGQFATPALVLLRQLRAAGARLHYHGDFDPAGLVIARRVFAESGAAPWRFGEEDYRVAPKGVPFSGEPGPTPWSPALEEAMRAGGRAVHEEALFATLAADLKR